MSQRYRRLVQQYEGRVYGPAMHVLRDRTDAADTTQEAYTRLWQHLDTVDDEIAEAWLLRVAKNLCVDQLRRQRAGDADAVDGLLSAADAEPTQVVEAAQLSDWLRTGIEQLTEPYRSLIVLRDLQQCKYADISAQLDLSLSQVKVYLHRARQQLRADLGSAAAHEVVSEKVAASAAKQARG